MRARSTFLDGLVGLSAMGDIADRRAAFRQSAAGIGMAAVGDGPGPLEGADPHALAQGVRIALADHLFDELDFLAPPVAGVATYEIAAALPPGQERRDLGRRVMAQLLDGSAETFVAVATRMALAGSAKGLDSPGVRARVALCMSMPLSFDLHPSALAWAMLSRRDVALAWVSQPSDGSLGQRQLAGQILEQAAFEVACRHRQGDELALRPFRDILSAELSGSRALPATPLTEPMALAYHRLLTDRESLVWRHVAVARGLLADVAPDITGRIDGLLRPELSPTEWRRGAVSLVAQVAVTPDAALAKAMDLIRGPLLQRDSGIAAAMVWALPRTFEMEPEAADELLRALAHFGPVAIADAVAGLREDVGVQHGTSATEQCARALAESLRTATPDEGLAALGRSILRDLNNDIVGSALRHAVHAALIAYVQSGASEAHAAADRALIIAQDLVASLRDTPTEKAPHLVGLLRDLDSGLVESQALRSLLLLDRKKAETSTKLLEKVDAELFRWLLVRRTLPPPDPKSIAPYATLDQREVRTLLHLVDSATSAAEGAGGLPLTELIDALTKSVAHLDRRAPIRRASLAALARALDAQIRMGAADPADGLLFAAHRLPDPGDLAILGEAAMHAGAVQLLSTYARLARSVTNAPRTSAAPRSRPPTQALENWVSDLPPGLSAKTEALQGVLARICKATHGILGAATLRDLVPERATDAAILSQLSDGLEQLARMTAAASQRLLARTPARIEALPDLPLLVERRLQFHDDAPDPDLLAAIDITQRWTETHLPAGLSDAIRGAIARVGTLPVAQAVLSIRPGPVAEAPLPPWLPPRRTVGGFYVHRQLGGGAVGTVFLVTRAEERHDPNAERFALKVPDYNATAARRVSEAEFLALFREEAGALLSLPDHPNLARFVTFDARAKPKPILVMELIEGILCDKIVAARALTTRRALSLLDGVLTGLETMHRAGVGHLDLKPSNIILRGETEAVLVDFGLSGRRVRPGCATGSYGAPEVWLAHEDKLPSPLPADIYSFACLAYEVLTGRTLFSAESEIALVSHHLTHDGAPPGIADLAENDALKDLAAVLTRCLRHNPEDRIDVSAVRAQLSALAPTLSSVPWPLGDATAERPSLMQPLTERRFV